MIPIQDNNVGNPIGVNYHTRQVVPGSNCSTGMDTIVRVPDETSAEDQTTIADIIELNNTLEVAATKTQILADSVDETVITCAALGDDFDYRVWINGIESISGSIADGNMEYSTNQPGYHEIEVKHQLSYATGYVTIEVVEVA